MGDALWVASTRGNNLQAFDMRSGRVESVVDVGVAPYAITASRTQLLVSNWGGDPPGKNDPQALSSGTPVRIDPKTGVANHGSVHCLGSTKNGWRNTKSIPVGLHPSGMVLGPLGRLLYVANANSDTVSVIDTARLEVVETIDCRPDARLPF